MSSHIETKALGLALHNATAASHLFLAGLDPAAFSDPGARAIYEAMARLWERGDPVEPSAVHHEVSKRDTSAATGAAFGEVLAQLEASAETAHPIEYYLTEIRNRGVARKQEATRSRIVEIAADHERYPAETFRALLRGLTDDLDRSSPSDGKAIEVLSGFTLAKAREEAAAAGAAVSTGFASLDESEFLLNPGKLYVVAARPSEGKTATMLEMILRMVAAGVAAGTPFPAPIVLVTYEENRADIYLRMLLREVGADAPRRSDAKRWLRLAWGAGEGWGARLQAAADRLDGYMAEGRLAVIDGDDSGGDVDVLLETLRGAARELGHPFPAVFIDYFQKVRPPRDLRGVARQQQLQAVSDLLRVFAKGGKVGRHPADLHFAAPVVVGAQVNREAVRLQPELNHLRECDDLANDATGVLTLWRPTDETKEGKEILEAEGWSSGDLLRVLIAKNRDGQRDKVLRYLFDGPSGRIDETAQTRRMGQVQATPRVIDGTARLRAARPGKGAA